jgi:hypothetical protein
MEFEELNTIALAEAGEEMVNKRLKQKGYSIYEAPSESHPVDTIAIKDNNLKYVEVKTKEKLKYYESTGFDSNDAKHYLELTQAQDIPLIVLFVDASTKTIYGNYIEKIQECLIKGSSVIMANVPVQVYRMDSMVKFDDLTDSEVEELNKYQHSNYSNYKENKCQKGQTTAE